MLTRPTRWFGSWGHPHLSDESLLELHALLVAGEHSVAARYLRHVKQCDACAQRLDGVREDAAALRQDVTASVDARITRPVSNVSSTSSCAVSRATPARSSPSPPPSIVRLQAPPFVDGWPWLPRPDC